MGYSFGGASMRRTVGVDTDLVKIATLALAHSPIDMSIPWRGGKRTAEQQKDLFNSGNTRCDGYTYKSYHQSGKALDLVPWYNGKLDYKTTERFQIFARIMLATFKYLHEIGEIPPDVYLHWGGFWSAEDTNNDGILSHIDDKFGWDQPHWEFRSKPQTNVLIF